MCRHPRRPISHFNFGKRYSVLPVSTPRRACPWSKHDSVYMGLLQGLFNGGSARLTVGFTYRSSIQGTYGLARCSINISGRLLATTRSSSLCSRRSAEGYDVGCEGRVLRLEEVVIKRNRARSHGPLRATEPQTLRKLRSRRECRGCASLRSTLASIWRMRSRVTENCFPTSSRV